MARQPVDKPPGELIGIAIAMPEDPADCRPAQRARLANVLLPGAGLVAQDRVGLGLLLGLAFWIPLTAAFYATWIAPGEQAAWQAIGCVVFAPLVYLAGQLVLGRTLARRAARIAGYAQRAVPLMRRVYDGMAGGDWLNAQLRLDEMLAFDPENIEANLAQARLLAIQRKYDQAARAYARCRRLDSAGRWAWELGRETELLPK